ncbi:Predicted secreted protein [Methanosarcina thermophila]|jgi:inhibitor of cysteine peptidase|uniref:Predicted secreted protein n=3 Tax=Methanosarcina thermophila TaxID=2210 RepID=A0A1I7AI35_METTE|nr:protease inhibitor I42 family protein [Methanosarcina thermophila]ALK06013.1 MAG: hypothetical protein AAY43_10325 [Methanosarcina sp. 795]AKB12404.1 hypothetical protein MSTHT_0646 [Methanosarcina thermophila TM-1]AKB14392.1 hypothetical protein MSTHC_0074 [Methanosarcina thermophila CHTI-55]NLU58068.1 protease inhibitor I42 family protein [Methanosarcina thermophila]SFT74611.1 Predicted secreted protein [Methanosarcina thermophila]
MNWKKSLILILVLICIPVAAISLNSETTSQNGDASAASKATSQATISDEDISMASTQDGDVSVASKAASQAIISSGGDVSMVSKSTSEVTVKQGESYTVSLKEDTSTGYNWKVTHSDGLKLLSDTNSDGERELKFLAAQKGKQTIKAEYYKSGEESLKLTSEFVLNVV